MIIASDSPTMRALFCCSLRQLIGQHRDEDDVVDAEDDLEDRQRDQRDRGLGGEEVGDGLAPRLAGGEEVGGEREDGIDHRRPPEKLSGTPPAAGPAAFLSGAGGASIGVIPVHAATDATRGGQRRPRMRAPTVGVPAKLLSSRDAAPARRRPAAAPTAATPPGCRRTTRGGERVKSAAAMLVMALMVVAVYFPVPIGADENTLFAIDYHQLHARRIRVRAGGAVRRRRAPARCRRGTRAS